jgi:hypothetical protein
MMQFLPFVQRIFSLSKPGSHAVRSAYRQTCRWCLDTVNARDFIQYYGFSNGDQLSDCKEHNNL